MRTPGRPHTLRARLVATVVLLLAVGFAVIGVTTTLALRQFLFSRLDRDVIDASNRFVLIQTGRFPLPPPGVFPPRDGFLGPVQGPRTLGAVIRGGTVALLTSAGTRWAAATTGTQGAASLELGTGTAVMAIGGFIGSDPYPTLPQFQQYVAGGEIRYFVEGGTGPGRRDSEIATWVREHYTAQTVDGRTVYDLNGPAH